jgi:hypothetical protein
MVYVFKENSYAASTVRVEKINLLFRPARIRLPPRFLPIVWLVPLFTVFGICPVPFISLDVAFFRSVPFQQPLPLPRPPRFLAIVWLVPI